MSRAESIPGLEPVAAGLVHHGEPGLGDPVPQQVRFLPVLAATGLRAPLGQLPDLRRDLRRRFRGHGRQATRVQAQDLHRVGQEVPRLLEGGAVGRAGRDGGIILIDVADEAEQRPDGSARVEVLVHGGKEASSVLRYGLRQHPARLTDQPVGHRVGCLLQSAAQGPHPAAEPLPGGLGLTQPLFTVVQLAAEVGVEQEEPDHLGRELLQHVPHGEEVAVGLGHLLVAQVEQPVVEPEVHELLAGGAHGLGALVLVVGEQQVLAAAVELEVVAQVLGGHHRTLDVPARAAAAPGGVPAGLVGAGRLPEGEVQGIALLLPHLHADAAAHLLHVATGEEAVLRIAADAEVDVAVHGVGVATLDESLDEGDDLRDVLGDQRVDRGRLDVQLPGVLVVQGDVPLRHLPEVHPLLAGAVDDLVVHVGEVLDVGHLVAQVLQVAADHVARHEGEHVPHVGLVLDGHAADVHAHLAGAQGLELAEGAGHAVVDAEGHDRSPWPGRRR